MYGTQSRIDRKRTLYLIDNSRSEKEEITDLIRFNSCQTKPKKKIENFLQKKRPAHRAVEA